jgi:thioredoxin reductase (NADPH)
MHDITIIGAGPAGLSAATTARVRNKRTLVISNRPQSSPLAKAPLINNYPGIPQATGLQLIKQMVSHARGLGAELVFNRVISIVPTNGQFTVVTSSTNFETRSIILATGAQFAKPFKGEKKYLGKGVSYCATCDGMLYKGKEVCVVGLGEHAVDEANFLAEIGTKVMYLAKKPPEGLDENIMVTEGSVVEIKGADGRVSELAFKTKDTDKTTVFPCDGVFILRPSISPDALMSGLEIADDAIVVDEAMSTNIPGVFAAGDCVGQLLQISKAVGEGQRACVSAIQYLDQKGTD